MWNADHSGQIELIPSWQDHPSIKQEASGEFDSELALEIPPSNSTREKREEPEPFPWLGRSSVHSSGGCRCSLSLGVTLSPISRGIHEMEARRQGLAVPCARIRNGSPSPRLHPADRPGSWSQPAVAPQVGDTAHQRRTIATAECLLDDTLRLCLKHGLRIWRGRFCVCSISALENMLNAGQAEDRFGQAVLVVLSATSTPLHAEPSATA